MRFTRGHRSPSPSRAAGVALAALALLATGGGCESTLSNDVFSADIAYLNAVPRRAVLHLASAPSPEVDTAASSALETASNALGPGTAELWRMTREVTWQIDHQIFGVLRELEAVTDTAPTVREDTRRIWGPYRDALSPVEVRLVVTRPAPGRYAYAYEQRAPGGRYTAPVSGTWRAARGVFGQGTILFDFAAAGGQGRVDVAFERHAGGVNFTLDLDGLADETTGEIGSARYEARRDDAGAGELAFTYQAAAAGQRWAMRSQWRADGSGRADARVVAAEGADGADGADGAIVRECWDTAFERVFAESPEGSIGDPEACVFEPAEPPTE
jgi:hypothetical protein